MNKYSLRRQMEPASRLKYLWLVLGTICSLFSFNGRWDIALAAWLAPFFLLRFMRTSRTRIGLTGVWLATALAMLFSFYSLQLLTPLLIVVGLLFSTVLTLPYLLDRLLTPRLILVSGLLATLLFPLSRVAGESLISFTPAVGSVFSLAYTQYGNVPLLQIISVTGVYGVSFLIAWFASVGNWIWEQHFAWPRIRAVTLLYSGLLALVLLGGSLRLAFSPHPRRRFASRGSTLPVRRSKRCGRRSVPFRRTSRSPLPIWCSCARRLSPSTTNC